MREKLTTVNKKKHLCFLRNVKAIPEEFQHALVVADIGKMKIKKVVRNTHVDWRSLLKDEIRK